jgi:hypothetical protein
MIQLKDNFISGDPISSIPADWLNTVARWLNSLTIAGGARLSNPYNLTLYIDVPLTVAWHSRFKNNEITIAEGDIELGPDTIVKWADITGAATTVTAEDDVTTWVVWVNVDISVDPPTAEMYNAETVTALTDEQKMTTYQKLICSSVLENNKITSLKICQSGNITIPRAAG